MSFSSKSSYQWTYHVTVDIVCKIVADDLDITVNAVEMWPCSGAPFQFRLRDDVAKGKVRTKSRKLVTQKLVDLHLLKKQFSTIQSKTDDRRKAQVVKDRVRSMNDRGWTMVTAKDRVIVKDGWVPVVKGSRRHK